MNKAADKEGLKRLGITIQELRKEKKISQAQLAFSANISISQLSKIETGKNNTSFSTLIALARVFNVTLRDFLEDFDYPVPVRTKSKK